MAKQGSVRGWRVRLFKDEPTVGMLRIEVTLDGDIVIDRSKCVRMATRKARRLKRKLEKPSKRR